MRTRTLPLPAHVTVIPLESEPYVDLVLPTGRLGLCLN